ncbi:MAG: MFS transporter, partial [Hadesarchaea archaeon]|nr:MFS transporter [Hadesarchaea archaeon]
AGLICIGFLITGISLLILPMGLNLVLIGSFLGIFGIGRGLIQPQINALVTEAAPQNLLGGLVSIYNIMKYAGQMAAPITLGWVITFASIEFAFWVSGTLGISAFVIAFLTICK